MIERIRMKERVFWKTLVIFVCFVRHFGRSPSAFWDNKDFLMFVLKSGFVARLTTNNFVALNLSL